MTRLTSKRVLRDLGLHLRELRQRRELTQEKLAERLKVSPRWLQSVEAGRENLTIGTLVRLANALKVPMAEFFAAPSTTKRRPGRPRSA